MTLVTDWTATWERRGSGWSLGGEAGHRAPCSASSSEVASGMWPPISGEGRAAVARQSAPPDSSWANRVGGRAVRLPGGAGAEQDKARADLGGAVAGSSQVHADCPLSA